MSFDSPTPQEIRDTLEELNPEALMYDGFDAALVGIIARCSTEPLALYDRAKCIQILVDAGATGEEAEDYFCYNVEGCWAGPNTPFIGSFNLDPIGIRYPMDGLEIITEEGADTEIFFSGPPGGDAESDSADVGSSVVDSAAESGGPVGSTDGNEESA